MRAVLILSATLALAHPATAAMTLPPCCATFQVSQANERLVLPDRSVWDARTSPLQLRKRTFSKSDAADFQFGFSGQLDKPARTSELKRFDRFDRDDADGWVTLRLQSPADCKRLLC